MTSTHVVCARYDSGSQSTAVSGGVDPSANIVTVVNDLSSRGITLKAGELVITGAVAVTKDCKPGDHVVVSYEGLGEVSCTLAGMALTAAL
jgi:2-keto-4-pentenoate hydratase